MSDSIRFKEPIPSGYRIYYGQVAVAGVGRRKPQAQAAASGRDLQIVLEFEPANKHDRNAVKVVARYKGWFLKHSDMIGYLPRDLAEEIASKEVLPLLKARPKELWVGDRGGMDFIIDLLGPKKEYKSYFEPSS